MLAALAAFVAWNFLSMLWADFPDAAWTGSDKTMLYAAGFLVFALGSWSAAARIWLLGAWVAGVLVMGIVVLAQAAAAENPASMFKAGRLLEPTGYENSTVALWTLALWPALYLASTRAAPAYLRGPFLGAAGVFAGLALVGQSRGWFLLLPLALAAYLLLARQRLRLLLGVALVGVALSPAVPRLLAVFRAGDRREPLGTPVDRAALAILLVAVALTVVGTVWAYLDRAVTLPQSLHRRLAIAVAVVGVLGIGGGVAAGAAAVDDPVDWIERRWDDFTVGYTLPGENTRFTGSFGTDRYTIWRIAWGEFLGHPAEGIGSDNYAAPYLLHRANNFHEVAYPHSIEMRLLSQLGVVGTVLFVGWVGAAFVLALRLRRRLDAIGGGAIGIALTMVVYWLLHGSIDVLWEMTAIAALAFGMLGLASARAPADGGGEPAEAPASRRRPAARAVVAVAGLAIFLAASASLVLPWLSAAYATSGTRGWERDPVRAYDRLDRAAALNPLGAQPLVLEGSIALRLRDVERAREAFAEALEREPKSWYPSFQLALLESVLGNRDAALRHVERVLELNPIDPVVLRSATFIREGARLDPEAVNSLFEAGLNRELSLQAVLDLPPERFTGEERSSAVE